MTAVMRIETINFATMKRGSKEVRGIEDGGMLGLLKHNQRKLYNKTHEVKSKQATNIDKKRSHLNHYFKVISESDIEVLKAIPHRANQVGAFQMVFDFQDLTEDDLAKFHDKTYATKHAKMILAYLKEQGIKRTKSGIMLGLGETEEEVIQVLHDLADAKVDIVTIGQYLQPSKKHLPVKEYITPEQFAKYEQIGKELGFRHVESGALVRSSYHAEKHIH